jgi:hypothetical protein
MMKRWDDYEDEESGSEEEFRYSLPEGAKNLNDAFLPKSISVPDPVSVYDLAAALRMKPHLVVAGLMHLNTFASLTTPIDFTTVSALCSRYGVVAHKVI